MAAIDLLVTSSLQSFDKGLRSPRLSEQLSTVVGVSRLLSDNPLATFVNTVVVRLAEAFKDGSNPLRLCIARVLGECAQQLTLVYSSGEVVKKVLAVSHSNDPQARALTLQVLASIAALVPDNKQVHHLIVESLSSAEHPLEFHSASIALKAFAAVSHEFSSTMLAPVSSLLLSPHESIERKCMLIPAIATMRASVDSTQAVFGVGARLIATYQQPQLTAGLLDAMTRLAVATRVCIPDQISVLVDVLSSSDEQMCGCALRCLRRLASHAHMWTEAHLEKVHAAWSPVSGSRVELAFLDMLVALSHHALPAHAHFYTNVLEDLRYLSVAADMHKRVRFIELGVNVAISLRPMGMGSHLLAALTAALPVECEERLAKRLFRVAGSLLLSDVVSEEESLQVALIAAHLPSSHSSSVVRVELLCRLADRLPSMAAVAAPCAERIATEGDGSVRKSLLAFLLCPPGAQPHSQLVDWKANDVERYEMARAALRQGHWRSVALPLLRAIERPSLSSASGEWLSHVTAVADAQPGEYTLTELQRVGRQWDTAVARVQMLSRSQPSSSQDGRRFELCRLLSAALRDANHAHERFLFSTASFIHLPQQFSLPETALRVARAICWVIPAARRAHASFVQLSHACFGVAVRDVDTVSLLSARALLVLRALLAVEGVDMPFVLPTVLDACWSSSQQLELLGWANGQMARGGGGKGVGKEQLAQLTHVLSALCLQPVGLPRFVFQSRHSMHIKLSVSPSEVNAHSGQPTPFKVEGVIESSHPNKIHQLIVTASLHHHSMPAKDFVLTQTVEPHDDVFFKTSFLLAFQHSCQIDFSVEFIDENERKKWKSDARATLKVVVVDERR